MPAGREARHSGVGTSGKFQQLLMDRHARLPVTHRPHSRVEPPKANRKGLCGSVQCLLAAATRDSSPSVHAQETSHDRGTVRNAARGAQQQKGTDWYRRQHGPASQRLPRLKPAEQTAHVGATDPTPQDKGGGWWGQGRGSLWGDAQCLYSDDGLG